MKAWREYGMEKVTRDNLLIPLAGDFGASDRYFCQNSFPFISPPILKSYFKIITEL